MSYDFNTRLEPCTHQINKERYVIDTTDFRTLHLASDPSLNMRAPINGQAQVEMFISSEPVAVNDPTYGWSLFIDANRLLTTDRFYKILFNRPVRWFVPLIEVCYTTIQSFCLRCNSGGQFNDFRASQDGAFERVVDTDKLVQSVLKYVLTSRCQFYPQYTCAIKDYIGKKFGTVITTEDVSSQIVNALQNLKAVQAAQRTVQTLSQLEMLKDITGISTTTPDPVSVSVDCSVTSYGSQSNPLPVSFTIASTRQLVGNN